MGNIVNFKVKAAYISVISNYMRLKNTLIVTISYLLAEICQGMKDVAADESSPK